MDDFKLIIGGLFKLYRIELDSELAKIYWNALKGYEIKMINLAVEQYIKYDEAGEFMPKPANIIRIIERMKNGEVENQAYLAWEQIWQRIITQGNYYTDDNIAEQAIRQTGGWASLRMIEHAQEHFRRREFIDRYISLKESHIRNERLIEQDKRLLMMD